MGQLPKFNAENKDLRNVNLFSKELSMQESLFIAISNAEDSTTFFQN